MHLIFLPFNALIWHPERIFWVAVFFLTLSGCFCILKRRFWPCLFAAALWAAYIPWEQYCKETGADIRVDMLLIAPVLLLISIWGLVAGIWRRYPISADTSDLA